MQPGSSTRRPGMHFSSRLAASYRGLPATASPTDEYQLEPERRSFFFTIAPKRPMKRHDVKRVHRFGHRLDRIGPV